MTAIRDGPGNWPPPPGTPTPEKGSAAYRRKRDRLIESEARTQKMRLKVEQQFVWLEAEQRRNRRGEEALARLVDVVALMLTSEGTSNYEAPGTRLDGMQTLERETCDTSK